MIMKYLFTVLLLLNSLVCFSQKELEINLSYDKTNQILLIKLKNLLDSPLGLDRGLEAPKVFDGCVFYITNAPKEKYCNDEMFILMEYDSIKSKFKTNRSRRFIWMHSQEEKCFAVSLKENSKLINSDNAFVEICLTIMIPPKEKGGKSDFRVVETGVYEVPLN